MTSNEARDYIRARGRDHLQPDNSGQGYICPICGSGSGRNGTGITTKDGIHFTCWSDGCFTNADIIDIIGLEHGLRDFPAKLQRAAEEYGITIDNSSSSPSVPKSTQNRTVKEEAPMSAPSVKEYKYRKLIEEAHSHAGETDYFLSRGISSSLVEAYNLGYLPRLHTDRGEWDAVIFPRSNGSYNARNTDPNAEHGCRYAKGGNQTVFNGEALQNATKPIFITEGEIDALSIIEAGGEAIALGGTGEKALLSLLEANTPAQPLIVALDNDEAGNNAATSLAEKIKATGAKVCIYQPQGEYKDANECWTQDPAFLAEAVAKVGTSEELEARIREAESKKYRETNSAAGHIQDFLNGIAESVNTPCTSTGFTDLDKELDGGLYSGLYILGAISSLGKTSLCLQICDQIAQQGKDVLIFSLEMARSELMAKSISRHTLQETVEAGGNLSNAKTMRGIIAGARYANYSKTERELIKKSVQIYSSYAEHIFVREGIGDIGVKEIRAQAEEHIQATGNKPIILIDYLQILAPYNERYSDKQNTDVAVRELKRLSRDLNIVILAISSLNRENYSAKINMAAFKESGSIEYGSDCLLGLQYKGAGDKNFDAEKAATQNPRQIEIVILKQRNGGKGGVIGMEFYPMFNYFTEQGATH